MKHKHVMMPTHQVSYQQLQRMHTPPPNNKHMWVGICDVGTAIKKEPM
jgi:hypothetical protein